MGYNALSGTVIAYPGSEIRAATFNGTDISGSLISGSMLYGNGVEITEIPRIVANASQDCLLTVGSNHNSMVGEPNLTFDGTVLNVNGQLTASAGVSASVFIGDGSRLINIPAAENATGQGPISSLQFANGPGGISGSAELTFSSSVLAVGGGFCLNRRTVSDDYLITTTDYYVGVDTVNAAGGILLSLPSASLMRNGQTMVVKDEGGVANLKNVTVTTVGGETIDGQNTVVLESPYASIHLYCNGANKYFIY